MLLRIFTLVLTHLSLFLIKFDKHEKSSYKIKLIDNKCHSGIFLYAKGQQHAVLFWRSPENYVSDNTILSYSWYEARP